LIYTYIYIYKQEEEIGSIGKNEKHFNYIDKYLSILKTKRKKPKRTQLYRTIVLSITLCIILQQWEVSLKVGVFVIVVSLFLYVLILFLFRINSNRTVPDSLSCRHKNYIGYW